MTLLGAFLRGNDKATNLRHPCPTGLSSTAQLPYHLRGNSGATRDGWERTAGADVAYYI